MVRKEEALVEKDVRDRVGLGGVRRVHVLSTRRGRRSSSGSFSKPIANQASSNRLGNSLNDQVGWHAITMTVQQGAKGDGHWNTTHPGNLVIPQFLKVGDHAGRITYPPPAPAGREGEMPLRRERIGEVVKHQSGLMAADGVLAGPKPKTNQIFVLADREVSQPINTTHWTGHTS